MKEYSKKGRFGISNSNGEEILNLVGFPDLPIHAKRKEEDIDNKVKAMIYQSHYGFNNDEKKIVVAGKN